MFSQDYDYDGELSADESGKSPRGAGSAARFTATRWEQKLAEGGDLPGCGGPRRRRQPATGGEAFGKPPPRAGLPMDDERGNGNVVELRDYSSRMVRQSNNDAEDPMASFVGRQVQDPRDVGSEKELAMLTGKSTSASSLAQKRPPALDLQAVRAVPTASTKRRKQSSSSSSSSESSKKKKKKKAEKKSHEKKKGKEEKKARKEAKKKQKKDEKKRKK